MVEYNIEGALLFQPASFRLFYHEKEIQLSQKETEVLQLLCRHQQQVVERKAFALEVWGDKEGADISLNKSILTLRRKFESLGYLDAINTVPRVGYMLRLNVLVIDAVATEPEVVNEQPESSSHLPTEEKKPSSHYKRSLPYLSLVAAGLLSVLLYRLYALYIDKEASPLAYKTAYESPSLTVIEMADLKQSVNYPEFISRLPSDNRMLVSISNAAISMIDNRNGLQSWVSVFIMDPNKNTNDQLTCIADYIAKQSSAADKDADITYAGSDLKYNDNFQIKKFYSPCQSGTTNHLGDISTTLVHYSGKLPKGDEPSSWLQQVSFRDNSRALIFDFQVVYRAAYQHRDKNDFLLKLSQRSIKLKTLEQDQVRDNKYYKMIFNEYEDDDIFVKSFGSVDEQSITVLSSVFDGTLSHGLKTVM